jgi:hypothetical protein
MTRYTLDRFENGEWAVLEDKDATTFQVPRAWLPDGLREGDVLSVSTETTEPGAALLRFVLDVAARAEQLEQTRKLRERLPRGPKGDLSL